jgi:hypothetical protein
MRAAPLRNQRAANFASASAARTRVKKLRLMGRDVACRIVWTASPIWIEANSAQGSEPHGSLNNRQFDAEEIEDPTIAPDCRDSCRCSCHSAAEPAETNS